nr:MAG TPA: hypothetical protein [Caudoviricetes sp.]
MRPKASEKSKRLSQRDLLALHLLTLILRSNQFR